VTGIGIDLGGTKIEAIHRGSRARRRWFLRVIEVRSEKILSVHIS
jgi:hypothetical protein